MSRQFSYPPEPRILNQKHELTTYFFETLRRTPRHKVRTPFKGAGLNATGILLDGAAFRIQNIFDAAYVAQSVYQAYLELRPASFLRTLARSVRYRYRSYGAALGYEPPVDMRTGLTEYVAWARMAVNR